MSVYLFRRPESVRSLKPMVLELDQHGGHCEPRCSADVFARAVSTFLDKT